ncbi:MAG: hypothetical protein HQL59_06115 [Magnetococcales bacterium]|nr:hypothetical protein [Magnetococcales bacterium]
MDENEERAWAEILREATEQAIKEIDGAVPGARLRGLIDSLASKNGRSFPPNEFAPPRKFRDFLDYFESKKVIVTRVRVGQDMLVSLPERHSLLVEESRIADPDGATFRGDLFLAFTRISEHGFRYLRSQDRFEQRFSSTPGAGDDGVSVPPVTMNQSIDDRREFCKFIENQEQGATLLQSLNSGDHTALRVFGEKVREFGLQLRWHRFRIRLLEERIRSWANGADVEWQAAWWSNQEAGSGRHDDTSDAQVQLSPTFLDAMASLRPADLARISIPLDIVARLFKYRSR